MDARVGSFAVAAQPLAEEQLGASTLKWRQRASEVDRVGERFVGRTRVEVAPRNGRAASGAQRSVFAQPRPETGPVARR